MSITPEEMQAIISGQATVDDIIYMRQQQEQQANPYGNMPPEAQRFLQSLNGGGGQDSLGRAMMEYGQFPGSQNIKPGYAWDDIMGAAKYYEGEADEEAKYGYQVFKDQRGYDLDLEQQALAERKLAATIGSPEQDYQAALLAGNTPEDIMAAFQSNDPEIINALAADIGAIDPDTGDWRTNQGIQRLSGLGAMVEQQREQQETEASAEAKQQRIGKLNPELRAKEAYIQLTTGKPAAVNLKGDVFYGPDAEMKAAESMKPTVGNVLTYDADKWLEAAPRKQRQASSAAEAMSTPRNSALGRDIGAGTSRSGIRPEDFTRPNFQAPRMGGNQSAGNFGAAMGRASKTQRDKFLSRYPQRG